MRSLFVLFLSVFLASCVNRTSLDKFDEAIGSANYLSGVWGGRVTDERMLALSDIYRRSLECWLADPAFNPQGLVMGKSDSWRRYYWTYLDYPDKPGSEAVKVQYGASSRTPGPRFEVTAIGPERWGPTMKAIKAYHFDDRIILCDGSEINGFTLRR